MTNSSDSSGLKLLIIHGLNNNLEGLHPLRDAMKFMGFDPYFITLPGHGEDREEGRNFEAAYKAFSASLEPLVTTPYVVIAFSQGALFFQLWMQNHPLSLPKAQVLLAPALFIRRQNAIERLISFLPSFAFIKSQTPKKVRRYPRLYIWEYRTLFTAISNFQNAKLSYPVPTLIMMDPKDELIDVVRLKQQVKDLTKNVELRLVDRPVIKAPGLGKHHVFFHPDYFEPGEWNDLLSRIKKFLSAEV